VSRRRAGLHWLMVALVPPLRLGLPSQVRPGFVWLPMSGWVPRDENLPGYLERFFGPKMLALAALTLPLLAVEYAFEASVHESRWLSWFLYAANASIWLGFAFEFIVRASAAPSRWRYAWENWVDVAIVVLPFVDLLP